MLAQFSFFVITMIVIEYVLYKSILNPFILISSIYVLLINVNNLWASRKFGFYLVSDESLIKLLVCLFLVFLISVIVYLFNQRKPSKGNYQNECYKELILNKEKLIVILFYVGLISRYISLVQTILRFGIENLKGNAFGIFAHVGSLSIILLPAILVIFLENRRKIYHLISILLVFFNMFIYGGKYMLLINITYVLIFYALIYGLNMKQMIKLVILLLLFTALVFFITYVIRPILETGVYNPEILKINTNFALKHFFYYLLSPLIAMNYFFNMSLSTSIGLSVLFTVPVNIFKALFRLGNYVDPVNYFRVPISLEYETNVSGFFAEVVMASGWQIGIIYIILFFGFVYIVVMQMIKGKKNIMLLSYLLSIVVFLFFSNFLTVSGIVLNLIFIIIIEYILRNKIIIK